MIKSWMKKRRDKFQAWLDRPLEEKRVERQRSILDREGPAPWRQPLSVQGRPDPIRQLSVEERGFGIARIKNEPVKVSAATLKMLMEMDHVFMEGASQAIEWINVRTERRQARNLETATRQGEVMFDEQTKAINEMTEAEAVEFVRAQAQAIIARASYASDPRSADTTQFGVVTA
jgi:hypothetical protein